MRVLVLPVRKKHRVVPVYEWLHREKDLIIRSCKRLNYAKKSRMALSEILRLYFLIKNWPKLFRKWMERKKSLIWPKEVKEKIQIIRTISNKPKKLFSVQHYPIDCKFLLLRHLNKQGRHLLTRYQKKYKIQNNIQLWVKVQCKGKSAWKLKIQR